MHKEKREAKESENLENKMIASCRCESREQHSQYWANDNTSTEKISMTEDSLKLWKWALSLVFSHSHLQTGITLGGIF